MFKINDFVYFDYYLDGDTDNGFGKIVAIDEKNIFGKYVIKKIYDKDMQAAYICEFVVRERCVTKARDEIFNRFIRYTTILAEEENN